MWDFPQIVMMDSITVTWEFPFYFCVPDVINRRKSRKLNKTQRGKNANSKLRILLNILLTLFFLKHRVSYFNILYSETSMYFLKGVCSFCSVASWYSHEYGDKKVM